MHKTIQTVLAIAGVTLGLSVVPAILPILRSAAVSKES